MPEEKSETKSTERSEAFEIIVSLILIFALVGSILLLYFQLIRFGGEILHLEANKAFVEGKLDQAEKKETEAINIASFEDRYYRNLSQIYLSKLQRVLNDQSLSPKKKNKKSQILMQSAIQTSEKAVEISGHDVANWANRGFIYRNLINVARGADREAIENYKKAVELEPTNPYLHTELARAYIAKARLAAGAKKEKVKNQGLSEAEKHLNEAISLKPNYWSAHYQQAIVYDMQGKLKESIQRMRSASALRPKDHQLAFQLGILYWRNKDLNRAKVQFQRAINIFPKFANARYFLGLIYDKQGKKDKAIVEFEKIASLSNENKKRVQGILKNLREGKPALGEEEKEPSELEEIPELEGEKEKKSETEGQQK